MNKLMIAIALGAALAACKQHDAAPAATAAPAGNAASAPAEATASATTPAAGAPAPAAAAAPAVAGNSGLPKECADYLNRAKACFAKANPAMAAMFQKSLDDSKAHWIATTDKATLSAQCLQASAEFSKAAAALKCE